MGTSGYIVIICNNKSYFLYNHWDSNELFHFAVKVLRFLLSKFTHDEISNMISEVEFISAASAAFRGYDEEERGSETNTFGYVLDDEDRGWNQHHVSLFKILRDKKAYYDRILDGVCPDEDVIDMGAYSVSLNFDAKTVSYSAIYPTIISFDSLML